MVNQMKPQDTSVDTPSGKTLQIESLTSADNIDLTQIKIIERAKQEWEVTVDALSALICVLDRQMHILRANRAIEHWQFGEVLEVKGKEIHDFLHQGCNSSTCYLAAFLNQAWEQLAHGQSAHCEMQDDILNRHIHLQVQPISPQTVTEYASDTVSYAVLVLEDITEQKKAEAALHKQTLELKARNEELNAFAHTVAHNLKGPLIPIIGHAELLINFYDTISVEKSYKALESILQGGRKMDRIIDELLLLASVRKEEVQAKPLDMANIVIAVQKRLEYMVEQHQVEFVLPDAWPIALGYAPWIEEVWANYISNGIKYGGTPPRLELGATVVDKTEVRFWIRDNGPGLQTDELTKLFTPFTQLNQVQSSGHGLGLSIVRRIVEKLDGKVNVESAGIFGKGCTFSFTLPFLRPD